MGAVMISGSTEKAGDIKHVAANAIPFGWLKANGAAVSRSTYAALFAVIGTTFGAGDGSTTFNLPDLRGEFLRGFDDARGVDAGRAIGSAQAGDNAPHAHGMIVYGYTAGTGGTFGNQIQYGGGNTSAIGWQGVLNNGAFGATQIQSAGAEARPRNVAMLAVIKY